MTIPNKTGPALLLIDGKWLESHDNTVILYPYNGEPTGVVHNASLAQVEEAVESAHRAWLSWANTPAFKRAEIIARAADILEHRGNELAAAMTFHTGKRLAESKGEIARSLSTLRISAEETKRIMGEVIPMDAVSTGVGKMGFTIRVPMGVVAGISPFNAPMNTVCHKLGPALGAGNTLVLKPHPHGAIIAAMMAEAFLEAGLPPGVFNLVNGGPEVGRALVGHPLVEVVNFTGSGKVADQIIRQVGLKRVLLELGGNAATIVHKDANIQAAAAACAEAAFGLTGQSCVSTQRLYVHREVYDEFLELLRARTVAMTPGDPMDPTTGIGPMINEEAARRVEQWIREAEQEGARIVCGGGREGTLVEPTIIANVAPRMKVVCEEVFGPVVTVSPYDDIEEAIGATNDTPWGLKSGIFTASIDVMMLAARKIMAGTVNVNGPSRARVDHEPSGGLKQSGWGKEGPRYAIEEMTYLKMVTLTPSRQV